MEKQKMIIDNAPVFFVSDILKAGTFYKEKLGFDFERYWGETPSFCMPTRDGLTVMLQQVAAEQVKPNGRIECWDAYFWIKEATLLFQEFKAKGVEIVYEPLIREHYEMKEFAIKDLDGHILAFGQNWEGE
ncbi:MAG: VOC family protein [Flammeovirgaceae bacterium]